MWKMTSKHLIFPCVVSPTVQVISSYFEVYDMTHGETELREQNRWIDEKHKLWQKKVHVGT